MTKAGFLFVLNVLVFEALGGPVQYTFALGPGAQITAATVDPAGNFYFAGNTFAPLPTTPGVYQGTFGACAAAVPYSPGQPGCQWGFVGKLSPTGTLIWLTYLADTVDPKGSTLLSEIAIDAQGGVYVGGIAYSGSGLSTTFPVTPGAFETSGSGTFIAKFNSSGSSLVYATYLTNIDDVNAMHADRAGNLYLGMDSRASDLPLVHPLSGMGPGTSSDVGVPAGYLAELNAAGSGLLFATWVNSPGASSAVTALALDAAGDLYLSGTCFSLSEALASCVPTTSGADQNITSSGSGTYIMKLSPDRGQVFSILFPMTNSMAGIVVDAGGNVTLPVGPESLAKLDASGSLLYTTSLQGSSDDAGITGLVLDSDGNAIISGFSSSPDFPTTSDAWQPCHPVPDFQYSELAAGFIEELSADGQSISYATFVGPGAAPPNVDIGSAQSIAGRDASGDLYLMGGRSLSDIASFHVQKDRRRALPMPPTDTSRQRRRWA